MPQSNILNYFSPTNATAIAMDGKWDSLAGALNEVGQDAWLARGRGDLITTISHNSLTPGKTPVSSTSGHNLVASYNWHNKGRSPAIYVPGGAPLLKDDVTLPLPVPRDSGREMIDANAAYNPTHPLEPIFRAAAVIGPARGSFNDTDIVVNRNTLRKLFDFCRGVSQRTFRVNLFTRGKTLLLERCEERSVGETGPSTDGKTENGARFGKNFELAMTQHPEGLEDSECHHRVIKYDFGGLKCVVRFEVDAILPAVDANPENDVFLDSMNALDDPVKSTKREVIVKGRVNPDDRLAEIKTTAHRFHPMSRVMPQLWFGRTKYLLRGLHINGTFETIRRDDLEESGAFAP